MEQRISRALTEAGEAASAAVWHRMCRDLDSGLRVAVVSHDPALPLRITRDLEVEHSGVTWVPLTLGGQPSDYHDERFLGVHALLWATSFPTVLGAGERQALSLLERAGAPEHRGVWLAGTDLVDRISDDPARELAEVRERLVGLVPAGWANVREVSTWLAPLTSAPDPSPHRRRAVALLLLDDALRNCDAALERELGAEREIDELRAQEDGALARARAEGSRIASHALAALQRHIEQTRIDLRTFLHELSAALPGQIAAVGDLALAREVLPHWLQHVVSTHLADRLARTRLDVLRDLDQVGIAPEDTARAELVSPGFHPPPIQRETDWAKRILVSVAVGAGSALVLFGLWIPGAITLGGGLAWSAVKKSTDRNDPAALAMAATQALSAMGEDIERRLADQLLQIKDDLSRLSAERESDVLHRQADVRSRLEERRAFHRARAEAVRASRARLAAVRAEHA